MLTSPAMAESIRKAQTLLLGPGFTNSIRSPLSWQTRPQLTLAFVRDLHRLKSLAGGGIRHIHFIDMGIIVDNFIHSLVGTRTVFDRTRKISRFGQSFR